MLVGLKENVDVSIRLVSLQDDFAGDADAEVNLRKERWVVDVIPRSTQASASSAAAVRRESRFMTFGDVPPRVRKMRRFLWGIWLWGRESNPQPSG